LSQSPLRSAPPPPALGPAPLASSPRGDEADAALERLDRGVSPAEAERALRDLERVYRRFLGGGRALRRLVLRTARAAAAKPRRCLDIGAGGGHIAADLVRDAARGGDRLVVIGIDAKLSHLLIGRRMGSPQLPLVADAAALPLRDGALACAFSHLFFHHFDVAGNRRVLAEMCRVARSVVVVDLRRSRLLRWLVRPGLRLLRLGEVAYHDGVMSVERSYRLRELDAVVEGLPVVERRRSFPFRWALLLRGCGA
jgi:SAM-dependent methyltransferase